MTDQERIAYEHRDQPAVYLLHFDTRYKHAGHYLGQTPDLHLRLAEHRAGKKSAARLVQVIIAAGITWTLARVWECETWDDAQKMEKRFKRWQHNGRLCPICNMKEGRTE